MVKLQRKQTEKKLTPGKWSLKASITILLLLLCLGTGMAAGQEIYFEPGDTTLAGVGDTETLNFYLDQVPSGLSGYNLTLGISDPSVIRITGGRILWLVKHAKHELRTSGEFGLHQSY